MEETVVKCPNCGAKALDLRTYSSMMVLSNTQALFAAHCDHCGQTVSAVETIPGVLYPDVFQAASEVNAGMGRTVE
ncbi:CpXC domain-containing protein [Anaerotardibacter muris]|uniref:CpXC domain-containing protein n=1 Tax=Anaerotardibacter muris TaxID=2941505 RepID=UPI0020418BB2|nr:CpXC domain-containing protein [Anaerotardibacter muris]